MKKILLSIVLMAGLWSARGFAQCTGGASNCDLQGIGNVVVQITNSTPVSANQCEVTFNVSFDLSSNNGNKDIFIHSWLLGDYPSYFPCTSGTQPAPDNAVLGTLTTDAMKSFLDIGLSNASAPRGALNAIVNVPIMTSYASDNTVDLISPGNSPGMVCTKIYTGGTIDRFTINNIKVTINSACGSTIQVKTDVWSKNGTNGPAQCWVAGITQLFNDPTAAGFKNCAVPARQYSLGITTVDAASKNITYKVYVDMNDNGTLETGTDVLAFTSPVIAISSSSNFTTGGLVSLPAPYSNTQPYSEKGYLILIEGPTLSNSIVKYFAHPAGCFILPADIISVNATRNNTNVSVHWQTANEQNCRGFAVERSNGTDVWREVAFVPTQAPNGNSSSLLTYQYTDFNDSRSMTQYRIRQMDVDNRAKLSPVRSVRGLDQKSGLTVYPNPTSDGKVNVVFSDNTAVRELSLQDMSGRVVKQVKGITANSIILDNLQTGMYTLRVVVPSTGDQVIQKIIVNNK